jgi:formylglycine-generating enzyme required for sulfatase activity
MNQPSTLLRGIAGRAPWAVSFAFLVVACASPNDGPELSQGAVGGDALAGSGGDAVGGGGGAAVSPVALHATASDGAVLLEWQVAPTAVVQGFRVHYRKGLPGPPWDGDDALNGPSPIDVAGATHATVGGLDNDETYYFAVTAVSASGESPPSPVRNATPRVDLDAIALVPAGVFTMGAEPFVTDPNEEPAHPVYLDAFWIDRYVATNAEFRACVEAGACGPPARTEGFIYGLTKVDDYFTNPLYDGFPVVYLEHDVAQQYCAWRGMRLPTEAEWEKAARGTSPVLQKHVWGDSEPTCEQANYNDEGVFCVGGPVPPGSYPDNVSPYGVVDMAGNVWQWTTDWFDPDYYPESPCASPKGPASGTEKVLRGGAWYYDWPALTVTYRNHWPPKFIFTGNEFGDYRGFSVRCVKDALTLPCDPKTAVCEVPVDAYCWDNEEPVSPGPDVVDPGDSDAIAHADVDDPEETWAADADAGEGPNDGGDSSETDADTSGPEPDVAPCVVPQDEKFDPVECFSAVPPACPSGLAGGCEEQFCACALGVTTEPGTCGSEVMDVTVGWRDVSKNFFPFDNGQPYEICQGFQGGVHLAIRVDVVAPQIEGSVFFPDVHGLVKLGDTPIGVVTKSTTQFKETAGGTYQSGDIQVIFEPCKAETTKGKKVTLELLVRDADDHWGRTSIELELIDAVDGPYLDPANKNPC